MGLTRNDLLERLQLHEDSFVERKPEGGNFKPTLVAFANSVPAGREAVLFIGVRDDGEVLGLRNPDSLQKKLQRFCQETCHPPVSFTTELLPIDGKQVLAVLVAPSSNRPHFAGPAYVRVGTKNMRANDPTFDQLVTGRLAKAAALLKYQGSVVTVVTQKLRLGQPEFAHDVRGTGLHNVGNQFECRLFEVNPFFARFEENGRRFAEPLKNLELSYDEEKHRPLLIVNLDGS